MSSVNILCPNGRRQTLKVAPNTTILQILEEVCLKRGFDATKHDIKHGRSVLDISATFRFSGVPNNAKLEMVEREKPRSVNTEVTIALQLENGERRQKVIQSDSSLADMVKLFALNNEDLLHEASDQELHPVIVNMREEIIGLFALENTTLKRIGLVSGRVALRLIYRNVESSTLEQIAGQINKEKAKIQASASVSKTMSTSDQLSATIPPVQPLHKLKEEEPMDTSDVTASSSESAPVTADSKPADKTDRSSAADIPIEEAAPPAAVAAAAAVAPPAAAALLPAVPVRSSVQPINPNQTRVARPARPRPQENMMVKDFKFPEETAGKILYQNELSQVRPEDYLPCERELTVFSMTESRADPESASSQVSDLPDDFFEVTKDDLQSMIRWLREESKQSENAPLLTASMRQAKLEDNFSKYKHAVIRFNFPDKMVLQAKFRPRETVHSLNKFVQSHLRDSQVSFHLYTTPPKKVLNDPASTLIQTYLVPMAIVYVSIDDYSTTDPCLCQETALLKQARTSADSIAMSSLPVKKQLPSKMQTNTSQSSGGAHAASTSGVASSSRRSNTASSGVTSRSGTAGGHVPKWYKTSGK